MDSGPLVNRSANAGGIFIEDVLKVAPLASAGSDIFTNSAPLWHPPDAQGIFGGICIAQSLGAAQNTAPLEFIAHSMHGHFVRPGKADKRIVYQVSRVNDGKSFATRKVKATQNGQTIYTAIISFTRDTVTKLDTQIQHSEPMPQNIPRPSDEFFLHEQTGKSQCRYPYVNKKVGMINLSSRNPHEKCVHQWVRVGHKMSRSSHVHIHLAALAYICDSYLIGTIPHVHNIWDFVKPPQTEFDIGGPDFSEFSTKHSRIPAPDKQRSFIGKTPRIGMMVTLSHTMFFHAPRSVKVDDWMLSESASHWAGNGRGVATQKVWSQNGTLLATCIQEGVIRLENVRDGQLGKSVSRL